MSFDAYSLELKLAIIGIAVSAGGSLLTLAGLVATFVQAKRSATAAEEAAEIAKRSLSEVRGRVLHIEVGAAHRLAVDLRAAGRDGNWNKTLDRCDQLRSKLAVFVADDLLSSDEQDTVLSAIDDMDLVARAVERYLEVKAEPQLPAPKMAGKIVPISSQGRDSLDTLVRFLAILEGRLRRSALEYSS